MPALVQAGALARREIERQYVEMRLVPVIRRHADPGAIRVPGAKTVDHAGRVGQRTGCAVPQPQLLPFVAPRIDPINDPVVLRRPADHRHPLVMLGQRTGLTGGEIERPELRRVAAQVEQRAPIPGEMRTGGTLDQGIVGWGHPGSIERSRDIGE